MLSKLEKMGSEQTKKRARKILIYGLIALIVVLSVITTVNLARGWFLQQKIKQLQTQVATVEEANRSLKASVDSIRRLRNLDAEVLEQMTDRLGSQLESDNQLKTQLEILEATNATVLDYLDTPIHPDVARLLSSDLDGEGDFNAAQKPDQDVRSSPDKRVGDE